MNGSSSCSRAVPVLSDGTNTRLLCPECGNDYVHPIATSCRPPGRIPGELVVDSKGVHLDHSVTPLGSGVHIGVSFWCESCHHQFTYTFHFHEGWTLFEQVEGPTDFPDTLWRH